MAYNIEDIEGIGPAFGKKMIDAGIKTVEDLLAKGKDKKGRQELEETTGIAHSKILTWCNMADMFRIKGVSSQYAELLVAAGVDTVKELRNRVPANLHKKMEEVNEAGGKKIVQKIPALSDVENFVAQAKELDPMMTY